MSTIRLDLVHGIRALAKTPLASIIAVISLAAGIGVTSVVFSVLDGLFLRPLPCPNPREIVRVEAGGFSYPDYEEFRRQCRRLRGVLATTEHGAVLRDGDRTLFILAGSASPNYFSVLGLQMALGLPFVEGADGRSDEPAAVISYALWRRFFGGDTNVIGRRIVLGTDPLTILGVAPRGFQGVGRFFQLDLWYPDGATQTRDPAMRYGFRGYAVLGRLAPGFSRAQAQAEAETIARRVMPQGSTRSWEQPVRLLSQLLMESLILAMAGLACALPLAYLSIGPVSRRILGVAPGATTPTLPVDHRALIASFLCALAATLVAGWLPALRSARIDLAPVLKGDTPVVGLGRWRFAGRNLLVMGQLGLSLVFLVATGLLMSGFFHVMRLAPGFSTRELLVVSFYGLHNRPPGEVRSYYHRLSAQLRTLPGILRVSFAETVPYAEARNSLERTVYVPTSNGDGRPGVYEVRGNVVDTNYFDALGIRLARGRCFGPVDRRGSPPVVMVSEGLARSIWGDTEPLGRMIRLGGATGEPATVIGVVGDIRLSPMDERSQPFVYEPFEQSLENSAYLLVATRGEARSVENIVRLQMQRIDPSIVPWRIETLRDGMWRKTSTAWTLVGLMSTLCGLICLLSMAGLYGLVSYSAACRLQEFGIRMALGAQRRDTLRLVLWHGLSLGLAGSTLGAAVALSAGALLQHNLPGVPGMHLPILLGGAVLLILVAVFASWIPARLAARVDPMIVLRCDR